MTYADLEFEIIKASSNRRSRHKCLRLRETVNLSLALSTSPLPSPLCLTWGHRVLACYLICLANIFRPPTILHRGNLALPTLLEDTSHRIVIRKYICAFCARETTPSPSRVSSQRRLRVPLGWICSALHGRCVIISSVESN